ncbi:MAG TPA: hypothetical protein PKK69_06570, partial [Ferruginibacter sp.]|nr:hypothetical protein [Ferruginibacter sp.]
DGECDWQCPTDESYYNITKTYNPVTTQWEVKICYTGPAIPANKSVLIPVMLLNSGCGQNPINYNLRFCQGITCNNYIVPAAFACNGSFDVKLGEITCVDEPCSADCPDTTQFSAALYNAVSCPGLPNLSVANIRVTHAGGPVNVMAPMERVKVTVKITTFRMAGIIPIVVTDEKTVWFHNGDATKDLCFYYPSNRIITNIQVVKTECAGPCPTGDCCDDPRYGLYDGKVRRFQDYVEPDFDAVLTAYNNGTANFAAYPLTTCKNECEIMADTWIQDLSQCTSDPVRLERIRRALIDVCKQSCQAQQGNNSITPFADANPTPSFESVIAAEFGGVVPNCAYDLISDPYPFGKTPELENDFAVDATPDICNRLSQLRNEAVSHGYTNDPDGVHDYLTAFYKQYYILEKAELEDLFSGCDQCNGIMNLPVELPPFMNGDAKPCLSCDEFAQLEQAFYAKYPTATPSDVKFEVLFRNFANHQTGFSHAYANYFDFKEKCDSNWNNFRDTGRLCELPLQLEMDVDLVAQCMEEKFYNALSNATTIYTAYIDSIRRAFRNNYTSKCLEAQPWLEYDAKLYEYHYTLYYYDQSSNLVKTVPPEGVQFLT